LPSRLRNHLSYANVVSSLCLFILLGGSAYAAAKIGSGQVKDNSIQSKDIKNSTITGKDVRNKSLTKSDFKAGQLPAGLTGPQGPQGAQGVAGTPATKLFASVTSTGNLVYGAGATGATRSSEGVYRVTFDRSLRGCVGVASPGFGNPLGNSGEVLPGDATGAKVNLGLVDKQVEVTIGKGGGVIVDSSFQLAVFC
jgi:hypothetical protein